MVTSAVILQLFHGQKKTGNLTLRTFSVVQSVIYDDKKEKVTGVRVIDAQTKEVIDYSARVVFVNAAALNSNLILLNSTSSRFPNGLGNDSGILGKYFAFHNYRARMSAKYDGLLDSKTDGRTPTGAYLPRFRNLHKQETDFLRGYAVTFGGGRGFKTNTDGFGSKLKDQLASKELNNWYVGSQMMGETIPKETNTITLDKTKKDEWGIPQLNINVAYDDNDEKMIKDFFEQMTEMYTKAGFTDIKTNDSETGAGVGYPRNGWMQNGQRSQNFHA